MNNYRFLRNVIAQHVTDMFNNSLIEFPYHNLQHTRSVVDHAAFLATYYTLSEEDSFIVEAAAWFHDTGHLTGALFGHEAVSALIVKDYLQDKNIEASVQNNIEKCIAATNMDSIPVDLPEMILCDADTWHLGSPAFRETDPLVKAEMELRLKEPMDNWAGKTLSFLENHRFYTGYCQTHLEAGKVSNIQWLKTIVKQ